MTEIKRLFFDLEVSGNLCWVWECGWKKTITPESIEKERAIICACWKWEGKKKIHSIEWEWKNGFGCDKKVVQKLAEIMNEADEIVAHFGDAFDIRWMKGRNFLHHFDPLPMYKTYDTCKVARKHFKLNSYKLNYLGEKLFGEGKDKTEYEMWKMISRGNDTASMRKMVKYCKQDVNLLERVYHEVAKYEPSRIHAGVMSGLDRWTCHHCGSDDVKVSKTRVTPKGMIQKQMQCSDCHRYYSIAHKVWRDYLVAKAREE
jgi:hypothetical protein